MFDKKIVRKRLGSDFLSALVVYQIVLFSSCERESLLTEKPRMEKQDQSQENINYKAIYSTHHTMSWEDAVALAEDAAALYFPQEGESQLRSSGARRMVNGGRVLERRSAALRAGGEQVDLPDTMAYICNFADSAGFAVICADDRVECPVLACVESGTLGDSIDNPGVALFLENAQQYMEESLLTFEAKKESLREMAERLLEEDSSDQGASLRSVSTGSFKLLKGKEEVTPLLTTTWAQSGSPYNDLMKTCKSKPSGHAPAGCWAVAVAQLMGYYQYPKILSGNGMTLDLDWDMLTNFTSANLLVGRDRQNLSQLFALVGKNVGMDYDCDGSGAKDKNVMSYLKSIGYASCATSDYSFEKVKGQLDLKRPVLMTGDKKKILFVKYGGHAWVVDGYSASIVEYYNYRLNTETGTSTNILISTSYSNPLLHINWGWGGINNGYFSAGCFDVQRAVQYDTKKGTDTFDYKYDLKIHTAWR